MTGRLRPAGADRTDRERGSGAFIMIVWALVLWLVLAVVVDVGLSISERERAADLANAAARAEAQNLDPAKLRQGTNVLDNDDCQLADGYITSEQIKRSDLSSAALDRNFGSDGCEFQGGDTVTVAVTITYAELVFPIFGASRITVTQRGTAVVAAGTN